MDSLPLILGPQVLGWTAALLTLLTFVCVDMRRLRLLALAGNAAFIAYGTAAELLPVLVLHLALVPVNLWRLNQAFQQRVSSSSDLQAPVPGLDEAVRAGPQADSRGCAVESPASPRAQGQGPEAMAARRGGRTPARSAGTPAPAEHPRVRPLREVHRMAQRRGGAVSSPPGTGSPARCAGPGEPDLRSTGEFGSALPTLDSVQRPAVCPPRAALALNCIHAERRFRLAVGAAELAHAA